MPSELQQIEILAKHFFFLMEGTPFPGGLPHILRSFLKVIDLYNVARATVDCRK